ncbi:cupin domain-containing protein [Actinacidiphila oryziradicis]|uniref:Cupin domain-containing protein n=1 Tax=Actinacidiphila oryziradicis TaxID=2571141 RepID=A0A4U0T7B1_9ACTN|nr:cupin domain-containing protein [Actinacidiphila oryziradicis]TKA09035.1 cupin domain-containing protein [Actinacidiphila oryziradicis]
MPAVRTAEAVVHEVHGARFTSYAAPARGSKELCAWRLEVPANLTGVAHTITREEVFLVLSGSVRLSIDGKPHTLTPGDAAIAPAGSSVRLDTMDEPAAAWVTTSVGLEGILADGSRFAPPWVN